MPEFPRFGQGRVPSQVRALTDAGERVLTWARDVDGEAVAATYQAVYLPSAGGDHVRIPYERIDTASWEHPVLSIVLAGPGARRYLVQLEEPGELPPAIRERVTATIALAERVTLAGGAGARITARRAPGHDELAWTVRFDEGVDPRDPQVRAQADAAIAALRSSTGL